MNKRLLLLECSFCLALAFSSVHAQVTAIPGLPPDASRIINPNAEPLPLPAVPLAKPPQSGNNTRRQGNAGGSSSPGSSGTGEKYRRTAGTRL
jgi:hypothetical protein